MSVAAGATHIGGDDAKSEEATVGDPYLFEVAVIRRAAEAVRSAPYGVLEDMLEDQLYLGCVVLHLEDVVRHAVRWVAGRQTLILNYREEGHPFPEVVRLAAGLAHATQWMDVFMASVCVDGRDPKTELVDYAEELEALSMAHGVPVLPDFAAQAFLMTEPAERKSMLARLLEVSSPDRGLGE